MNVLVCSEKIERQIEKSVVKELTRRWQKFGIDTSKSQLNINKTTENIDNRNTSPLLPKKPKVHNHLPSLDLPASNYTHKTLNNNGGPSTKRIRNNLENLRKSVDISVRKASCEEHPYLHSHRDQSRLSKYITARGKYDKHQPKLVNREKNCVSSLDLRPKEILMTTAKFKDNSGAHYKSGYNSNDFELDDPFKQAYEEKHDITIERRQKATQSGSMWDIFSFFQNEKYQK